MTAFQMIVQNGNTCTKASIKLFYHNQNDLNRHSTKVAMINHECVNVFTVF